MSADARNARLSVRVPQALKEQVRVAVVELQKRGLRASESELLEMLVAQGLDVTHDELGTRLRAWRVTAR
jgi:hypothetical protein